MNRRLRYEPTWADVLDEHAVEATSAAPLVAQLSACEAAALAFCRLLEQWARGDAQPPTADGRLAALREAADRVRTGLSALGEPLDRYLLEGRTWYGGPGVAELRDWESVLDRAGVRVPPERVAQAYLELAVLVRALEGLTTAIRLEVMPDRGSLWAGLFDLRENLLGGALEDLRALAVI